jgi:hypothetical protein
MSKDSPTEPLSPGQAHALVYALYRFFFGRDPDEQGLGVFASAISQGDLAAHFETLLKTLESGAEARDYRARAILRTVVASFFQDTPSKKTVISLGSHCYTSWLLKQAGIKSYSTPFDWLFSNPGMISHCLRDDFKTFLDRSYYRSTPFDERVAPHANQCDHLYYLERFGIKFVFNHRDPTTEQDYAYFQRAVARFRECAKGSEPVTLLCTLRDSEDIENQFFDLQSATMEYFSSGRLVVAGIRESDVAVPSYSIDSSGRFSRLIRFVSTSPWLDLRFQNEFDDMALISIILRAVFKPEKLAVKK